MIFPDYPNKDNCHEYLNVNNYTGEISVSKAIDRDDGTIKELNGICYLTAVVSIVNIAYFFLISQKLRSNTPVFV